MHEDLVFNDLGREVLCIAVHSLQQAPPNSAVCKAVRKCSGGGKSVASKDQMVLSQVPSARGQAAAHCRGVLVWLHAGRVLVGHKVVQTIQGTQSDGKLGSPAC